jgi:pimeloyl-ACP methyl ester carboxylesterase
MDIFSRDARFVCGKASKNLAARLGALCLTTISILLWTPPSHSGQNATASADVPYETKDLTFDSSAVVLSGRLFMPPRAGKLPVIIYVTGSGDDDVTDAFYPRMLAHAFAPSGIGIFVYNKRGVGKSQGTYSQTRFDLRAQDTVAAFRFVKNLPEVDSRHIGMWGISQGGWIIAMAAGQEKQTDFVILVSPGGVNPKRQMEFYLQNEWRRVGMNEDEITKASALHEILYDYFAGGKNYEQAQSAVNEAVKQGWLDKYCQANFRKEVPTTNRLPNPAQLAALVKKDPSELEFYRSPYSAADYERYYLDLIMPTLVIYGGKDSVVPISESRESFKAAFAKNHNRNAEIKVFEDGDHGIFPPGGSEAVPGYLEFMREWILNAIQKPKSSHH